MKGRYFLTLLTALLIGGALITGSSHAASKTAEKTPINDRAAIGDSDASITIRVNTQFAKDYSLKDAGIHAQTKGGIVSLSGEVASQMISAHAFWTVWQVLGVKWVKNDLTVKEKT